MAPRAALRSPARHLPRRLAAAPLVAALLTAAGCYMGTAGAGRDAGNGDGAQQQGGDGGVTGLPCDVATLLAASCLSCHSSPPESGVPMSLASYEDLTAPSPSTPAETVAQRSVARMLDPAAPMPPGATPDPAAADILSAWIAAGYPRGDCGSPDGGTNPYNTAATCTSGQYIRGEEELGTSMHPGGACISCHASEGITDPEAQFTIAGTLFPTAHEYDDCVSPPAAGAHVVITDNNGADHTLTVGASGNFYLTQTIPLPYRARVVYNGRERAMTSTQQSGDCNSCHTLNGANGAPGRILLP